MAANNTVDKSKPKKRKQVTGTKPESHDSAHKKPKLVRSKPRTNDSDKPFKPPKPENPKPTDLSNKERRVHAKELADSRKKKRKRYFDLEQELARLWEKMRNRDISKEDRYKLVSVALEKMKGKIHEIACSHVSSRVLQTCVKYCSKAERDAKKRKADEVAKKFKAERDAVFEELKPHLLSLASNKYAFHLVTKMLDNDASKKQLADFISSLRGHVARLLRTMVGSKAVSHAYKLGNATQRQQLLVELYSTELQLFKDLAVTKESRLVDVISKLGLRKSSVLKHMTSVIQPILEKGIVDNIVLHKLLIEYFTVAEEFSATDVIKQLSDSILVQVIDTNEGSRVGILCVKHGSAKERKKIIKGMKGRVRDIVVHPCGSMVLVSIVSVVDDTKLITKIVIDELQNNLKELVFHQSGRLPFLQLLRPNCTRFFSPYELESLSLSIPCLSNKIESDVPSEGIETEATNEESTHLVDGGKKDPLVRRQELLVKSGLAERLVDVCITSAGELLKSKFGKEVIYEVVTGGADGILRPTLDDKLNELYEAIATLVAEPKSEESKEEPLLENFFASCTIKRLVLDCPAFAITLWNKALTGKCELWAQGHSRRVISAFLESSHSKVNKLAKKELQPLVDAGTLKIPETRSAN